MKQDIHIVLSSSNVFSPYCATTMASILYNISSDSSVHFYILTYDITPHNKKKFEKLKKIKDCTIEYPIFNSSLLNIFDGIKMPPHVTKMTYARILIPDILPQINKAIFIDSDTIVRTDISKLYNINLSNNCFAAVEDACSEYHSQRLWGQNIYPYFNCGLLLINSQYMRKINYINHIKEQILLNGNKYQICDQDILNDTFHQHIKPLDISWNFHHEKFVKMNFYRPKNLEQYSKILNNPNIMHYTGAQKPWYPTCNVLFKNEYLFYFRHTPFYKKLKIQHYTIDNTTLSVLSWKDIPLHTQNTSDPSATHSSILNKIKLHAVKLRQKTIYQLTTTDTYKLIIFGKTFISKINTKDKHSIKILGLSVYNKTSHKQGAKSSKPIDIIQHNSEQLEYISALLLQQNNTNKKLKEQLDNLKCILEAQKIHPSTFLPYKNAFAGKDVALICTGPTAKQYKPFPNTIHIGVNGAIYLPQIKLDYLFIQDYTLHQANNKSLNIDANSYIGNNCKKFYGIIPDNHLSSIKSCIERIPFSMCHDDNISQYILEDIVCNNIAQDLSREPIGNFLGTPFSALQFILYANPKTIYLVGWDCNSGYAYNKKNAINPANYQEEILKKHFIPFINTNYPNIRIISINPVGLRGYFEDIDI